MVGAARAAAALPGHRRVARAAAAPTGRAGAGRGVRRVGVVAREEVEPVGVVPARRVGARGGGAGGVRDCEEMSACGTRMYDAAQSGVTAAMEMEAEREGG